MFFSDDHEPIHVHIEKDGNMAKYNIEPIKQVNNWGFKKNEINEIETIVVEKSDMIIKKWKSYFNK